jgi:hypothetical protein
MQETTMAKAMAPYQEQALATIQVHVVVAVLR